MLTIRTILHPTDFSEQAHYAFALACSLARDHQARLVVLHVAPPPTPIVGEMMVVPPQPVESREDLEAKLHTMTSPYPEVDIEYRVEEGNPIPYILQEADELGADMIVMGTHGRRGIERLLMGSVAEQIVRKAQCPVLTIKHPFPEAVAETQTMAAVGTSM